MALLYQAELRPTKLELLAGWLPSRDWFTGSAAGLERVAAYRFDDPAGEVGVETILVRSGDGPIHQVPLTYRAAPLEGGEPFLIGTTDHSVLGPRWVYDGCADPVYAAALADAILRGADQAELMLEVDGQLVRREPSIELVHDTTLEPGTTPEPRPDTPDPATVPATRIPFGVGVPGVDAPGEGELGEGELVVLRRLGIGGGGDLARNGPMISGRWGGRTEALPLAYARIGRAA